MKQELQDKLVEILGAIQTATGKASDFAMEQLPDIAQQYVAYGRLVGAIHLSILSALILGGAYGIWRSRKLDEHAFSFIAIFGGTTLIGLSVVWMMLLGPTIMVWVAPKVWLLKELAGLIK